MDRRRWPYDPHAPPDDETDGWAAAAREQDGWVRGQRNGHGRPGHGREFDPEPWYDYEESEGRHGGRPAGPTPPRYPPPADGYRPRAYRPPPGQPPPGQPPAYPPEAYRPDAYPSPPPPAASPRGRPAARPYPPQDYPPPRYPGAAYPPPGQDRRPALPPGPEAYPPGRDRRPALPPGPEAYPPTRAGGYPPGDTGVSPAIRPGMSAPAGTGAYPTRSRASVSPPARAGAPPSPPAARRSASASPANRAGYPADRYPESYPARGGSRRSLPEPAAAEEPADEAPDGSWASALLWTAGLFVAPVLLYLAWALTRSGVADAGCVDATGAPCPPPRVEALEQLVNVLPALVGALGLGLVITLALRRIVAEWHSFTVGLAGAVIGAGIATLIAAIVS